MASVSYTGSGEYFTVLILSPHEAFVVRKALKKLSKTATHDADKATADAIVKEMEKD